MLNLRDSPKTGKNESFKKGVFEVISLLLLVGVLVFGVKGVFILSLNTTSPMLGVSSGSMEHPYGDWKEYFKDRDFDPSEFPFQQGLQEGDLVFIEGVDSYEDIQVGDVIVFHSSWGGEDRTIIHRIASINREGRYVITKGDANQYPDPKGTPLEAIVGRAIFSIPYLGYPATILRGG